MRGPKEKIAALLKPRETEVEESTEELHRDLQAEERWLLCRHTELDHIQGRVWRTMQHFDSTAAAV